MTGLEDYLRSLVRSDFALVNLLIIAIAVIAGLLFYYLFFRVIERLAKRSRSITVRIINDKLREPSLLFFVLIGVIIIIPILAARGFESETLNHILTLVLIGSIAWLVSMIVVTARKILLRKYRIREKNNLKARKLYTQFKVSERILIFLIILVAFSIALMTFETIRKVGISLLTSAGILGIILGFAAQRLIATIIAGFQVAFTQPIRIDDVVIVEGEWGWVEEITLTYVVVRLWDKRRMIVPTNYFIEKPFQNWTRASSDLLGTVFIHTDYNVPFDALRNEVTRLLQETSMWDRRVNVLQVTDTTGSSVETRILISAADSPTLWNLRVHIREKMIEFIRENYPGSLPRTRVEIEEKPGPQQALDAADKAW